MNNYSGLPLAQRRTRQLVEKFNAAEALWRALECERLRVIRKRRRNSIGNWICSISPTRNRRRIASVLFQTFKSDV